MKKLKVTIKLEMWVPDDWEVVHTSEDTPVLKLPNGQFLDLAIEPLFATDPEDLWTGAVRVCHPLNSSRVGCCGCIKNKPGA